MIRAAADGCQGPPPDGGGGATVPGGWVAGGWVAGGGVTTGKPGDVGGGVTFVVLVVAGGLVVFGFVDRGVVTRDVVPGRLTDALEDVGAADVVVAVLPAGAELFVVPDVDKATIPTTSSTTTTGAAIFAHTGRDRTQSSNDPVTTFPSQAAT